MSDDARTSEDVDILVKRTAHLSFLAKCQPDVHRELEPTHELWTPCRNSFRELVNMVESVALLGSCDVRRHWQPRPQAWP